MEGRFRKLGEQDRRSGNDRRDPEDRGVFDWMEAEAREEHRSGRDRRSNSSGQGSIRNRQDARQTIPFSVAPHGEVRAPDGSHWHCILWDVSLSGLCLIASGRLELPIGSDLTVALNEVVGVGSMVFKAQLRWFADDSYQTYLGLQFSETDGLPAGCFLEHYLQVNFDA